MAFSVPPAVSTAVTNYAANNATSSSSSGSSGSKTKDFIARMLRDSFQTWIKGAADNLRKAVEKNTNSGGAWKVATLPIPEVPVDFFSDPNAK